MAWTITTPPYAEPIHLNEAKDHIRLEVTDDDGQMSRTIRRMVAEYERAVERSLVTRTMRLSLSGWPYLGGERIKLPRPPLCYISSVQYVDTQGTTQTWDSTLYQSYGNTEEAWLAPVYGEFYPYVRPQLEAVMINYVAGFITPFSMNVTTNVITASGRTFTAGDIVRLTNSGGSLPAGLATYTDYYVISPSGSTFSLSLTAGGSAVDVTTPGTGTHFIGELPEDFRQALALKIANAYESRGEEQTADPLAIQSAESRTWIGSYS